MSTRIERTPFAARLCENLGTCGVALEGRIFLAPHADARVLRHELAHVAQQRMWRGRAVPTAWTEAEAHAAAAGLIARPCLPLDPRLPACWEEVGHYYTVYYVLLAVGVRDDLARRIAFYAQLPDEVSDLDAFRAGMAMPGQVTGGTADWIYDNTLGPLEDAYIAANNHFSAMLPYGYGRMAPRQRSRNFDDFQRGLQVQRGLHALTGAGCEVETRRRTEILRRLNPVTATLDYGIALHAFGDSFAHREANGERMYPQVVGHGPASGLAREARERHLPEMTQHPDAVGPHHAEIFIRYATEMRALFVETFPAGSRVGAPMPLPVMTANLRTVIAASDAAADTPAEHARQIVTLRRLAGQIVPAGMHAYDPENQEDVPIDSFLPLNTDIRVTRQQVQHALSRAVAWSDR